jgi:hypothetical protein
MAAPISSAYADGPDPISEDAPGSDPIFPEMSPNPNLFSRDEFEPEPIFPR